MEETLTSFMIDSEIVAIDPVTGAFRTFQELSYRSRKDVELGNIKIRVGIFAFDLMLLNGKVRCLAANSACVRLINRFVHGRAF